ncbi:addiction module antitoxin, RelB/DinJ family [Varibaculum cambriense]|uniref:Addiction module antitoxin, RelB/DinJ family n=2 Tax=Varibaculum cambriense TaxID=184870 RepID=A0AB34WYG9_9ACTO|nr:addiction module antitoxin, RelB/DinJ family [Varibaculum cambriense]
MKSIDLFVQITYYARKRRSFMATTNISIRMDVALKKEADQLFNEMGMNISTAFNVFVRQAIRERAIPFQIQLGNPNRETIAAMLEAEQIAKDPCVPGYASAREAFAAALSEDE